jgi:hypothetical protein
MRVKTYPESNTGNNSKSNRREYTNGRIGKYNQKIDLQKRKKDYNVNK